MFMSPSAHHCHKRLTINPRAFANFWQFLNSVNRDMALPAGMTLAQLLVLQASL